MDDSISKDQCVPRQAIRHRCSSLKLARTDLFGFQRHKRIEWSLISAVFSFSFYRHMPRRNYNDSNVVATFTEDLATTQKSKYMAPRSMRLASHNKTRVAYFHDEGVGNYHYGVSVFSWIVLYTSVSNVLSTLKQERHPMKPHRLTLTNHLVLKYGLHQKMEIFQPRKATDNEILEFHAADYVDFLKRYVYP